MDCETPAAPRANIVCVCPHEPLAASLTNTLRQCGYAVFNPDNARHADICLIDLRRSAVSTRKAKAMAAVLRRKSPESSMLFMVDPGLDPDVRAALRRYGEVAPAEEDLGHVAARCRQIIRLRNIAEETGERLKSLAALNRLVDFPIISAANSRARVLIAGAPGPAALSAINAVSVIAESCVCVLSAGQAMRALDHETFDCAIILPMKANDPLAALTKALRRHSRHAAMAVIQVADNMDALGVYAKQGARDFILKQDIIAELGPRAQLAARRVRLARSMAAFLRSCAGEGVRDPASGVFTTTFLAEHGARLCARADQTGRPLSMTLVELGGAKEFSRHALHQAARLIARVSRAEDIAARIAPNKFIVAYPATTLDDAVIAGKRIEGVLTNTAFRDKESARPFALTAKTLSAERVAGASIEETIATLLKTAREGAAVTPPLQQSPQ